jgi:hypothetical protein
LANNPKFKLTTSNKILDDVTVSIGTSAVFLIYAGTQPADASSVVTAGNTIVASLAFPSTNAFGAAAARVITANTITSDSSAAGGTAGWASIVLANATTRVIDMSVGTSGADLNLNSVTISTGAAVSISAFTVTGPA